MSSTLHVEFADSILTLTLRDLANGNSFSLAQAELLSSAIHQHADSCRGLLLQADSRIFCAGGNLKDYAKAKQAADGITINRRIRAVLADLAQRPFPTVAAVEGDCYGGGLELISAFDRVIASPHALFGFWQRKVGLSFGWGGGARMAARIGERQLKCFAIEARNLNAYEACSAKLIDQVSLSPRLEARTWLLRQQRLPVAPQAPLKQWTTENEVDTFETLWWNEEHLQALKRFR